MLILANWKMNGNIAALRRWRKAFGAPPAGVRAVLCPPFPLLAAWSAESKKSAKSARLFLGAQDVSAHISGAHTGEVSAAMLKAAGCKFAIAGHSERRARGEGDVEAGMKVWRAAAAGLTPVLCVGESGQERRAGQSATVVRRQLRAAARAAHKTARAEGRGGDAARLLCNIVVAYEPVWAIGSGKTPGVDDIAAAARAARRALVQSAAAPSVGEKPAKRGKILYGGSVSAENIAEILRAEVDGALVGGASLDGGQFAMICKAAAKAAKESKVR